MTEHAGIVRAFKALGDKISETESQLRYATTSQERDKKEILELRGKVKELTEKLKQAEEDRDAACSYALQLEKTLDGCRAVYNDLTAGGADVCKKS